MPVHETEYQQLVDKRSRRTGGKLIDPSYDGYGISSFAATMEQSFGGTPQNPTWQFEAFRNLSPERHEWVIVIDGLSYLRFLDYYKDHPFLKLLHERGDVYGMTSTGNSTTPEAMTTVYTGQNPQTHGLPEMGIYDPKLGLHFDTLTFKPWNEDPINSLKDKYRVSPTELVEGETLGTSKST
jgi:hypothetical protein